MWLGNRPLPRLRGVGFVRRDMGTLVASMPTAFARSWPMLGHVPGIQNEFGDMETSQLALFKGLYERCGNTYELALPGFGDGPRGECVVTTDAAAMMGVLKSQGSFPTGAVEKLWMHRDALRNGTSVEGTVLDGFYGRGAEWKRLRFAMQADLISPQKARGYLPGICKAAELASAGARRAAESDTFNRYLNHSSFDMFSSLHTGHLTNVAANDRSNPGDPGDLAYCEATIRVLDATLPIMASPACLLAKGIGMPQLAPAIRRLTSDMGLALGTAERTVEDILNRRARGESLTPYEESSYTVQAAARLEEAGADAEVTMKELKDLLRVTLTASIDTTSSLIAWVLVHLALNPDAQQRLRDEVNAKLPDGNLSAEVAMHPRREMPFLAGVIRESHRLTPSMTMSLNKHVAGESIHVGGYEVPDGTLVSLVSYPLQNDPAVVGDDAADFKPHRFSDSAVEARKDTPAEILDHRLFAGPFSAGARMCPGSRVAALEAKALVCRLVHDWSFRFADDSGVNSLDDVGSVMGTVLKPQNFRLAFEKQV